MLDKFVQMVRYWWKRPHWFTELWSSIALVGFGVWSHFQPISDVSLHSFAMAIRIMPAPCWSYAAGLAGIFQFGALWIDQRLLRGLAAFVASWLFSVISLSAVLSIASPIDVFPICFLGISVFALIRAAGNAK